MTTFKIVTIRTDGKVCETEITGYDAEPLMIMLRAEKLADKRALTVTIFQDGHYYSHWYARATAV